MPWRCPPLEALRSPSALFSYCSNSSTRFSTSRGETPEQSAVGRLDRVGAQDHVHGFAVFRERQQDQLVLEAAPVALLGVLAAADAYAALADDFRHAGEDLAGNFAADVDLVCELAGQVLAIGGHQPGPEQPEAKSRRIADDIEQRDAR